MSYSPLQEKENAQLEDHSHEVRQDSQDVESLPDIPPQKEPTDVVPDGGYGWVCVASVFAVNTFAWGVVGAYGPFLAYYLASNTFPDASSTDYAFIGGLNFTASMLIAPLVTIMSRRLGPHIPMLIGVACLSGGFIAASFANAIWQLYLTQGVMVGLGVGFLFIPSIAIIPQWFDKKRSLANGIATAGSGIGGVIFSFITQPMIDSVGLAWALRIIGIVSGVMNLVATILIRHRNGAVEPNMRGLDLKLLKNRGVVLLLAWSFVIMFGYVTLLYSLPDFAVSLGLNGTQAANLSGFLNLGTAVGRPLVGILSDRFGRIKVSGLITAATAVTIWAFWIPANSYGFTIFFAIVNGALIGIFWTSIGPLATEIAGLKHLPSLLSLAWLTVVLPTTFSEVIALKIRRPDSSHPYLYPQIFAGLSYTLGSIIMFFLWREQRKPGKKT